MSKSNLQRSMSNHPQNVLPFSCACGRSFKSSIARNAHRRDRARISDNAAQQCGGYPDQPGPASPAMSPAPLAVDVKGVPWKAGKDNSWLFSRTAELICSIDSASVEPAEDAVTSAAGYSLVCSYSWLDRKSPTVRVPGAAPRFLQPPSLPMTIQQREAGHHGVQSFPRHKNKNTNSNIPKYPCEAAFRAMEVIDPTVKFNDIDVVVSRNSLRKLLDFCAGRSQRSFRINLFVVGGNTLIIEICERSPRDMEHGAPPRRWALGHDFEHAVTVPNLSSPGQENSTSHQRMVRYKLGNLTCAVRFEVDAMYYREEEEARDNNTLSYSSSLPPDDASAAAASGLVDAFHSLSVQSPPPPPPEPPSQKEPRTVQAVSSGVLDHHDHAAEITAIGNRKRGIHKYMPQLWFGRTPWLIRGYHKDGTFDKINVDHVTNEAFIEWESKDKNQLALRKLSSLLEQLRDTMVREGGRKKKKKKKKKTNAAAPAAVLVHEKGRPPLTLEVFSANLNRNALPDDVLDRWFW